MSWSIGFDTAWQRDIGYGVPAVCDHPGCDAAIDRGLAHVCGGEAYGGDQGCGLYFCGEHLYFIRRGPQRCDRCSKRRKHFTPKPDVARWVRWKLKDASWRGWRKENPEQVAALKAALQPESSQEEK